MIVQRTETDPLLALIFVGPTESDVLRNRRVNNINIAFNTGLKILTVDQLVEFAEGYFLHDAIKDPVLSSLIYYCYNDNDVADKALLLSRDEFNGVEQSLSLLFGPKKFLVVDCALDDELPFILFGATGTAVEYDSLASDVIMNKLKEWFNAQPDV